jgi:hypothetical protein
MTMASDQEKVNAYLSTVRRMEPEIAPIDAAAFYASAAISLKRIADVLTELMERDERRN